MQKDITVHKIQMKNDEAKRQARLEQAQLLSLINNEDIDYAKYGLDKNLDKEDIQESINGMTATLKRL